MCKRQIQMGVVLVVVDVLVEVVIVVVIGGVLEFDEYANASRMLMHRWRAWRYRWE
jgi:hypothetical protein